MKFDRLLPPVPLLIVGVLLAVYGLFALTFNERGGGSTYVTLADHRLDAHLVGVVSLVIGMGIIAAGIALLRRACLRS